MKKSKIIALTLSVFALASCNTVTPPDSGDGGDGGDTPVTPVDPEETSIWTEEQKELLREYCGDVLPSVSGKFVGNITVEEQSDSSGNWFLQITDEATEFTIKEYAYDLEDAGWRAITPYNGSIFQTLSDGTEYVELTKSSEDKSVGYDMVYYFQESYESMGGDTIPSCNVITIFNDSDAKGNGATAWDEDDAAVIDYVLTTSLPFVELGATYAVGASSDSSNILVLQDIYTVDLVESYSKLLIADGFTLNKALSEEYDSYYLTKTLSDGAIITALLYYSQGNNFYFLYTPKTTEYSSWPTVVTDEIEEKTGVAVPEFEIAEGGTYTVYQKHGIYYIESYDLDEDFSPWEYTYELDEILSQDAETWKYVNWEETIAIDTAYSYDWDTMSYSAFQVSIELTTPTSTFSKSWPTQVISSTLSSLYGITDVTVPTLPDDSLSVSDKDMKYEIRGQEYFEERVAYYVEDMKERPDDYDGIGEYSTDEEIEEAARALAKQETGVYITFYDEDFGTYEAYEKILTDAGWYRYYDDYDNTVYEDPNGKVGVTLSGYSNSDTGIGETHIFIHYGTQEEHEAEFEFEESEVVAAIGQTTPLSLNKNMISGDVVFTSSDTTGKITVDEDGVVTVAEDCETGTTATITASVVVNGETLTTTCVVTAKKALSYTKKSAIDAIASLLTTNGYSTVGEDDADGNYTVTLNLGSEPDLATLKETIKTKCAPEGFTVSINEESEDGWGTCDVEVGSDTFKNSSNLDFEFEPEFEGDSIVLMCFIYKNNEGNYILWIKAYTM